MWTYWSWDDGIFPQLAGRVRESGVKDTGWRLLGNTSKVVGMTYVGDNPRGQHIREPAEGKRCSYMVPSERTTYTRLKDS